MRAKTSFYASISFLGLKKSYATQEVVTISAAYDNELSTQYNVLPRSPILDHDACRFLLRILLCFPCLITREYTSVRSYYIPSCLVGSRRSTRIYDHETALHSRPSSSDVRSSLSTTRYAILFSILQTNRRTFNVQQPTAERIKMRLRRPLYLAHHRFALHLSRYACRRPSRARTAFRTRRAARLRA